MTLTGEIIAWLKEAGIDEPLVYDGLPDAEPHTCVAVAISGGLGASVEGAYDQPTIDLMIRGNNGRTADELGEKIDAVIVNTEPPIHLGPGGTGRRMIDKGRFGGPPAFVLVDDRSRQVRSATYWIEVVR